MFERVDETQRRLLELSQADIKLELSESLRFELLQYCVATVAKLDGARRAGKDTEMARRHVAEQARLREEAEQRRLERQRRAEEALLRAEEERRQAAEAAAQATAGDEETTITVEPPEVPPPSGSKRARRPSGENVPSAGTRRLNAKCG